MFLPALSTTTWSVGFSMSSTVDIVGVTSSFPRIAWHLYIEDSIIVTLQESGNMSTAGKVQYVPSAVQSMPIAGSTWAGAVEASNTHQNLI
jgi:hypothetical protein